MFLAAQELTVSENNMILNLTIECVFGHYLEEQCIRVIEIEEDACLYDLHDAIQDAVDFGRDHPFTFYIANSWRGKRQWLSEKEGWEDREHDFCMIKLKDIYPLGRKKLYYLFDFGDQWTFEVRKARGSKKQEEGVSYPHVTAAIGPNPEQYPRFEE